VINLLELAKHQIGEGAEPMEKYPAGGVWNNGEKQLSVYVTESGDYLVDQYREGHGHHSTVAAGPELVIECIKWVTENKN
jgi:hypothetical protein